MATFPRPKPPRPFFILALALLSGAAGVGHQFVWTRRLVDLLGASPETFSKVVGAFFVGLALGAWWSTRQFLIGMPPWRRVAWAEAAVALLAIPILWIPHWDALASLVSLPPVRWLLPVLLVTPPAIAMGLVVPWMIKAFDETCRATISRRQFSIWLYATNTAGGVAVIPIVLLLALPRLGLMGTSACLIGLNLIVAGGACSLMNRGVNEERTTVGRPAGKEPLSLGGFEKTAAFTSGFLVLGLEAILQHQLAQVTINSLFSSATVLAMVLFALALAAAFAPSFARWFGAKALACALGSAMVLVLIQPFSLVALRPGLAILPYELTAFPYVMEVLKIGALAVLPALVAGGLVFPLLLLKADGNARAIGILLAWNGLGGWLGAETMQAWVAPTFGLWNSVTLVAAGYGVLFVAASFQSARFRVPWLATGTAALVGVATLVGMGARRLPEVSVNPGERLVRAQVSREGVVATVECAPDDWRIVFNNSYTLGGSRAQFNQERQAHLPLLLHGGAKQVACLGIATGSTIAGASLHGEVERIDAIELSPAVVAHARQFFAPYNRHVFNDPRVNVIEDDARWIIARREAHYDVVIGDLFLPWRTGEARLFAEEHFRNVQRSLKPGGLFCQWLPMFQLTQPQFETVARTFQRVFPDAFLVRGDFYSELPILGLIGGRELSRVDWAGVSNRCAALRDHGKTRDPLVRHVEGVAMMILGPLPQMADGPANTLGNAWLEWDAGKNILGMRTPWFVGVPQAEFARAVQRRGIAAMPETLRPAHDAGQFFLTLEIAAKLNLPVFDQLKQQMAPRLPPALRLDREADWAQWPMRIKPEPMEGTDAPLRP